MGHSGIAGRCVETAEPRDVLYLGRHVVVLSIALCPVCKLVSPQFAVTKRRAGFSCPTASVSRLAGEPHAPYPAACLCGSVKFQLLADPLTFYVCHCTMCQRRTGGAALPR
ncbi:GFA family protein [Ralstonia pickettii]|uniref:GFA family protein n=2 Tax=Burkholderiaceae TaxID=119060 RepID=UPI003FA1514C